ncbi:hypothetical protein LNAOJCKE_4541 [Methylorubrum aminovorans]|uniref:Uncharacterized protein n=1 Tax=Methylorubrum aminovorans TaxID=269069 RepID=A0ABQ4UNG6_9HYPH|nr:hypothetical protein [Methylorubrum aminovorans]GJE67310.1 hypothetical protein LNAOJCKE_4541 [Methylorubrum aminovorans]GMA74362.1 hypothetical protein GCM10025880_07790 [Methylorubrum aminovorans]
MTEAAEQKTIGIVEINGRIGELEAQRDAALARAAKIAGEKAEALDLVRILKIENDRLANLLNDRGGPAPAAATDDPDAPLAPAGAAATAH